MSDLADLTESLKRVVATPGTFTTVFPEATDDDLTSLLMDALCQVQLDGMLGTVVMSDSGITVPDLPRSAQSLVVLYAGAILIKAHLLNLKTHKHYAAGGGVVFEEDQATNILRDLLKDIEARKQLARDYISSYATGVFMADSAWANDNPWWLPFIDPLGGL